MHFESQSSASTENQAPKQDAGELMRSAGGRVTSVVVAGLEATIYLLLLVAIQVADIPTMAAPVAVTAVPHGNSDSVL